MFSLAQTGKPKTHAPKVEWKTASDAGLSCGASGGADVCGEEQEPDGDGRGRGTTRESHVTEPSTGRQATRVLGRRQAMSHQPLEGPCLLVRTLLATNDRTLT